MQKKINVSVRDIVDYSMNRGDIEARGGMFIKDSGLDGTLTHVHFQREMIKIHGKEQFLKEVYVYHEISNEEVICAITGRIDGILRITESDINKIYLYEIKTTVKNINDILPADHPHHLGQAQCYAYLYMLAKELKTINIRLVYVNREDFNQVIFEYPFGIEELGKLYNELAYKYLNWLTSIRKWQIIRDQSIEKLDFPFTDFRIGQKKLMSEVYNCINDEVNLFAQAPTGIGKTMGVMFPAIKALAAGLTDKIMYLTAKGVTSKAAVDAYKKLEKEGLNLRTVCITAKDKVCPLEKRDCDPERCDRAKEYYLKARPALKDALQEQFFNRDVIDQYANRYGICPFELSLDLALYCDLIICDYNYLFDPRIKLQRFFDGDSDVRFTFLIDEAHNLVDRGREMFSCSLKTEDVRLLKGAVKKEWKGLKKCVNAVQAEMKALEKEQFSTMNEGFITQEDLPDGLVEKVQKALFAMQTCDTEELKDEDKQKYLDGLFNFMYFVKVSEFYDKRYATFYITNSKELEIKLMCLDPSYLLKDGLDKGRSSILFSATLEPSKYYMDLLGGDPEMDCFLSLDSPFPRENFTVRLVTDISTKYKDREFSYAQIAQILKKEFSKKVGNYMAFFPSYDYMRKVSGIFREIFPDAEVMEQQSRMDDIDRGLFLDRFDEFGDKTLVAFAVMGGLFGEGIDLVGDKLSGAAVIGPGLPMVCGERELIKQYFDNNEMSGFDYAYTYPGINRVLQAAGRVIRTEEDKGFVILIDSRFGTPKYRALFPKWWKYGNISG